MRQWALRGTLAGLALSAACGLAYADSDTYQSAKTIAEQRKKEKEAKDSSWNWWPFGKKEAELKPPDKIAKEKLPTVPNTPEAKAQPTLDRELAKYLRRQDVLDQLLAVAQDTNDTELERHANLLQQKAWLIYQQRLHASAIPNNYSIDENQAAKKLLAEPKASPYAPKDTRPVHRVSSKSDAPVKEDN